MIGLLVLISFALSAAAGMGGSLILVPALGVTLGPKLGIAAAAFLLACNNVGKVLAYRRQVPIAASLGLVVLTVAGSAIGAGLLVRAPEHWVAVAIVVSIGAGFLLEKVELARPSRVAGGFIGFFAGATSGFSGTSGPLKGLALRALGLPRQQLVAAASVVSLAGDTAKVLVFASSGLLDPGRAPWGLAAVPLMVIGVWTGRELNRWMGERAYAWLFWAVMGGYSVRLLATL